MSLNGDPMPSEGGRRDDQAKLAGQVIYDNLHGDQPPPPLGNSMPPPIAYNQSNVMESGVTLDPMGRNGKMSSVRRTFCLFVTFDLILMFILWVLFTQLIGDTGYHAFEKQVKQYEFKTSLFDIVLLAAFRFIVLLLFYCLFRLRHWLPVAFTTAASSAVLIAKIFCYDFSTSKNNPLSYCLIIIAFVLAWVETWFMDFKVIPHEKKLEHLLNQAQSYVGYGAAGGIGPHYRRIASDDMQSLITEDNQFYSPVDSPNDSDNEDGPRRSGASGGGADFKSVSSSKSHTRQASISSINSRMLEENDYARLGKHSFDVLWSYASSPDDEWKLETGKDEESGIVHSKKIKGIGKVFRLTAIIDMAPKALFNETALKPEEGPTWNQTMTECRVIQVVDDNSDVLYTVAGEVAGGVISSRDFVNVRHWGERDGVLLGAGMACNHPDMPAQKKHIRGVNGAGGWVYRQIPDQPEKCHFTWFMNTDIKGWFPQKLIDANMAKVQMDFLGFLRAHITKITEGST